MYYSKRIPRWLEANDSILIEIVNAQISKTSCNCSMLICMLVYILFDSTNLLLQQITVYPEMYVHVLNLNGINYY